MFCKETVQMDHLLVWSFLFLQPSSNPSGVGRARHTHTNTHANTPQCSHSSRLKYNRLLLINMSKLSQFKKPLQFFFQLTLMDDVTVFLPNIPHVPRNHRDMFVAFLFVA